MFRRMPLNPMTQGRFVKLLGLAFDDSDRPLRAFPQASAESVAVRVRNQLGLAVDELNRPLGTSGYALPTAVAESLVDFNDFSSDHGCCTWNVAMLRYLLKPAQGRRRTPSTGLLYSIIACEQESILDPNQPQKKKGR
jgi:hypothetical protein